MADPDATMPLDAVSPQPRDGQSEESRTSHAHIEAARVRGSEPTDAFAPSGPTGESEFLAERLALFGQIACLASSGFLLMRLAINAFSKRSVLESFPVAHLAATAILLLVWILAGSRAFSNRGLRRLDATATIAASLAYAMMVLTMPLAWRPDQLVLLILNRPRSYLTEAGLLLSAAGLEVRMTRRIRLWLLSLVPLFGLSVPVFGAQGLTFPPSGENPQALVAQAIGPVRVTVDYSSPRVVRGQNDRRGKIWGELVPWGMSDLGFNGCASCPWRAGANENTTFAVTNAVKVQGQALPAGTYGLHMIPDQDEWTIIFSKDASNWGSFWYDPKDDALRVKTKAAKGEYHEWLTYEFTEREPAKATLALKWEELQVPISIEVENPNQLWVDNMRTDLRGFAGFSWQNWQQAAAFCAQNKINLPEGLKWAERAVSDPTWSGGQENFTTLATLSLLQGMNGRAEESTKTFDKALNHPSAQPVQIHMAARQLMAAGNKEQAMRVFQFNAKRFPNQWPVHVGLMRGYAAMGDKKKVLQEAKLAVAQAPDAGNRKNLQGLIKQLEEGKDIN